MYCWKIEIFTTEEGVKNETLYSISICFFLINISMQDVKKKIDDFANLISNKFTWNDAIGKWKSEKSKNKNTNFHHFFRFDKLSNHFAIHIRQNFKTKPYLHLHYHKIYTNHPRIIRSYETIRSNIA